MGVAIVLYPLSAFRAASKAALTVYQSILQNGTQQKVLGLMQTRQELYQFLDYQKYEEQLDILFGKESENK